MTDGRGAEIALNRALWAVVNERFTDAAARDQWVRPEPVWGLFGVPRRFDADLEQHCDGETPALFADVTYNFGGIGPLPIAHGNLLVNYQNVIYEYSPAGALVSIRPILGEIPGGGRATEELRDLVVGPSGLLHAFVGTFDPLLATGDPGTGTWREDTDPSWSIFNNGSYGGVAAYGDYVYVGDFVGASDTFHGRSS